MFEPIRILCVEDQPAAARLLQKRLTRRGYLVELAGDGEEGLRMWDAGSFHVLAVDHDMPKMTGLQLIRTLASRGSLPLTVMITGAGNETIAVEAMKLGAEDYIIKDPDSRYLELIPSVIERALEKRRLLEEKRKSEEMLLWEARINAALAELYVPVISGSSSIQDMAYMVLDKATLLTDSEYGFVSEIDPVTGTNIGHTLTAMMFDGCGVEGHRSIAFSRGADGRYPGLWGHCLNTRESFFTNDPAAFLAARGVPHGHVPIERFLSVPVLLGSQLGGQIALANSRRDYTDRDLAAVKRLAEYYALGIRRKRDEDRIKASLEEKEMLLREIHHRVKNNLAVIGSILNLRAQYAGAKTPREVFEELQPRIRSMAVAHELLYQAHSVAYINVSDYIGSLLGHLLSSQGRVGANIHVDTRIDDISLGLEAAIPLGILVTELFSNCVKHAFPDRTEGKVEIALTSAPDESYELVVKDDGIGLPDRVDPANPQSMGMELIDTFIEQLAGQMEVIRGQGTEIRVRFKLADDQARR